MSIYGDKCHLCGRNDFLPLKCDLCQLLLCTEHMAAFAHDCKGRDDNITKERPAGVGLGAALAANMAEVSKRFDGQQGWSTKEHYRIKSSVADQPTPENKYLRAYREKLHGRGKEMSEKSMRMSLQVRSMLLKSKATGKKTLHADDRFYLEVRFGGLKLTAGGDDPSTSAPEVVDYIFVSRLWTIGRTLDEVVNKHATALARSYPPSTTSSSLSSSTAGFTSSGLPTSTTTSSSTSLPTSQLYTFLNERTGQLLPLGKILSEVSPEEVIMSCDTLIVIPMPDDYDVREEEGRQEGIGGGRHGGGDGGQMEVEEEQTEMVVSSLPVGETSAHIEGHQEQQQQQQQRAEGVGAKEKEKEGAVVLIVQKGKVGHHVIFTQEEWTTMTVLDLKTKVNLLTGIHIEKQKLLYKGIMKDEEVLSTSKLKPMAKITLMTASK